MNTLFLTIAVVVIYIIGVLSSYVITKKVFSKIEKTSEPKFKSEIEDATTEYTLGILTVLSFFGIFCLFVGLFMSVAFKYLDKKFNLTE